VSTGSSKFKTLLDQGKPVILDGGLGSELARCGHDISSSLWSAELLINNPQAIYEVHRSYLDAGAQIITSASYQASLPAFASMGLSTQRAKELIMQSVEIAKSACGDFHTQNPDCGYQTLVAASIGPYGAYLADGSEYQGNYGVSKHRLHEFHQQRLAWLDQSGADVLACETIPDIIEAAVLAELLRKIDTPAWVSFSCADGLYINDGSLLREAVALFEDHANLVALGVNCTASQYITSLIGEIKSVLDNVAIVVYPNSGERYNAMQKCWVGIETPLECAQAARDWYQAGATIIGGCCRMGPAHITEMAKLLGY
jgi:homocysteine S-methyltransferase